MDKRNYDIGFIVNPESTEEEIKKITSSVTKLIEDKKGIIEKFDEWGRKKLAYPIEKHEEGIYFFINAETDGDVVDTLERRLKLNESVMRFMVVRLDDKLKKSNKLVKRWERIDKRKKKMQEMDEERTGGSNESENTREASE